MSAFPDLSALDEDCVRSFLREHIKTSIHLVSIVPDGRAKGRYFGNDVEAATKWAIDENGRERNIYWTVNVTSEGLDKKPAKTDIVAARFAHADIDPPAEHGGAIDRCALLAELSNLDCQPSFVVDSGNGLQPLWSLKSAQDKWATIEKINIAIAVRLGADHCHNIDRLLRLPGTVNFPNKKKRALGRVPVLASLACSGGGAYSLHQMQSAFPAKENAAPKVKANGAGDRAKTNYEDIELLTADDLGLDALSPICSVIEHPVGNNRSVDALRCAGDMMRAGFTETQVIGILLNPANAVSAHCLAQSDPRRAAVRTIEKVERDNETAPAFSEEALALRYADTHAHEMRHIAKWAQWSVWDGQSWKEDATLLAFSRSRAICREAANACDKSGGKLASAKTVAAVVSLARADRRLAAIVDQWDADPWLLNTPSGVVDLRTGNVSPHDPAMYMTKITAVAPGGECPLWLSFLKRVTGDDGHLQGYLQRLAGYALTGSVREHVLPFAYGTGGNGKGVFIGAISGAMGDYAVAAPIETFAASIGDRHPTELAMLRGARLVTAQETEEGRRWAESRIKMLTGGDPIAARFMRGDFFEFKPQFTLLIAGNHKPGLRSVDEAIRRRFHLIPFTQTIGPDERDEHLPEKLKAEWSGVLQWAIEGCLDWQERGLRPPDAVLAATEAYLDAQDAVGAWIEECCDYDNRSALTPRSSLYGSWQKWAERFREFVLPRTRFYDALETRGFEAVIMHGSRCFRGISVMQDDISEKYWNR